MLEVPPVAICISKDEVIFPRGLWLEVIARRR